MERHKIAITVLSVLIAVVVIWLGFDTTYAKVNSCTVHSKAWVTAEYSETTVSVDTNGYPSVDTDFWSEPASEVCEAVTVNGELIAIYGAFDPEINGHGFYSPPMPAWDGSMASDVDFDNFEKHRTSELVVNTTLAIEGTGDTFTTSSWKNNSCIDKLENYIQVDTWYSISYSSEF